MNFIKKWLLKRAVNKQVQNLDEDKLSLIATEFLNTTQAKYTKTLRDAEKINKAKLFSLKEAELRRELQDGLNGDDDDEDEEDEPDTIEDTIKNALIQKFLGNIGDVPLPTQQAPAAPAAPASSPLVNAIASLTPEQINQLKKKFLA